MELYSQQLRHQESVGSDADRYTLYDESTHVQLGTNSEHKFFFYFAIVQVHTTILQNTRSLDTFGSFDCSCCCCCCRLKGTNTHTHTQTWDVADNEKSTLTIDAYCIWSMVIINHHLTPMQRRDELLSTRCNDGWW